MPDPQLGWVIVHAKGGHAGNDQQHASVRRWLAPRDGSVAITGKLQHASENGDGVRGRLVSSRGGLLGEWQVKTKTMPTDLPKIEVHAGDTLDFAVDCVGDVNSDSYEWTAQLQWTDSAGQVTAAWNSATDFHGPLGTSLPQQVAFAWQLAYQRPITPEELEWGSQFVARRIAQLQSSGPAGDPEQQSLTSLCQQLLSSNEFLYVD